MSGGGRYNQMVVHGAFQPRKLAFESVTADRTLTPTDSGKVIFMGPNGIDITLPSTPENGLNYKIILASDYASANCTVTINGSGEFFAGSCATGADGTAAAILNGSSHDVVTFGSASLQGDFIEVICNSSAWFITGTSAAAAGIAAGTS